MPICVDCRPIKLLLAHDWGEKYTNSLCDEDPGLEILNAYDREGQKEAAQEAEIALGFASSFEVDVLAESDSLTWIQTLTAGVDDIVMSPASEKLSRKGIVLTNMSGLHRDIIAEHAMGFIINFDRRFHDYRDQQRQKEWERLDMNYITDSSLTILGVGSIGQEIAARAKAFNMEVTGVKRDTTVGLNFVDRVYPPSEMEAAVQDSDYVVAILPYTEATEEIIDADVFAAMPDSAHFINVGRGETVKEEDLLQALENEKIAGAGLDVFQEEPLPEDSPFYDYDNVIITPHVAGSFPDYYDRAFEIFLENLRRYRTDEELLNKVDYGQGY